MTKAIAKHEESCCRNPNRVCWMCEEFGFAPATVEELKRRMEEEGRCNYGDVTECPSCMLALILQTPDWDHEDDRFSYREAVRECQAIRNEIPDPPVMGTMDYLSR